MRKLLTAVVLGTSLTLMACDTAEEAEPAPEDTAAADTATLPLPDETPTPAPTDTATREPADAAGQEPADTTSDDY
jgi:hypothetical protein